MKFANSLRSAKKPTREVSKFMLAESLVSSLQKDLNCPKAIPMENLKAELFSKVTMLKIK